MANKNEYGKLEIPKGLGAPPLKENVMWMYISIILFWFLCGNWAIRMEEKRDNEVIRGESGFIMYFIGCFALLLAFCETWIPRLWKFAKGTRIAWKQARKG